MSTTRLFRCAAWALIITVAATIAAADGFARTTVNAVRLGNHPDEVTRVVMEVSDNIALSTSAHLGPDRIVVATQELAWGDEPAARRSFGAVRGLRYQESAGHGYIIIDLKEPALVKSAFTIAPRDGLGWRIVVDLKRTGRAAFTAAASASFSAAPQLPIAAAPAESVQNPAPPRQAAAPQPPLPAPAPVQTGRSIVVYSPQTAPPPAQAAAEQSRINTAELTPPPSPAPAAATAEPMRTASIAAEAMQQGRGANGSPMLTAPVPPAQAQQPASQAQAQQPAAQTEPAAEQTAADAQAPVLQPPAAAMPTKVSAPLRAPEPPAQPLQRTPRADGKAVVVIDPGHGGVDPGATGVSGIYEKHITLAMARELKKQLERSGRYKVHLTRDRDVFIRLRERVAIGRQYGADLFISLHADSVGNPQLQGLSVYTLSQNSSDVEAQALAEKENKADLIAGIDLSHESPDVAGILIDLAQRETMNSSAGFAGGVVDELSKETTLLANTHRFAGFAVLKAPDVPSILVELGYLSNKDEERKLRTPQYRASLAKGIARAVDGYFLQGQKARRL